MAAKDKKGAGGGRVYHRAKNDAGAFLPGVPLRDLTEEEYKALPDWQQERVDASGFYEPGEVESVDAAVEKAARAEDRAAPDVAEEETGATGATEAGGE